MATRPRTQHHTRPRRLAGFAVASLLVATAPACSKSEKATSSDSSKRTATITRTTDGVPHITSPTIEGVLFGQGYASAEDHACTLVDQVLKVSSQRARWLGAGEDDENIDSDFAWQAIGIDALARADYPRQPQQARTWVESYVAGWNAYLAKVTPSGLNGWCKGQPWVRPLTGPDLYAYARSVMLRASSGALADYLGSAQPPGAAGATTSTTTATTTTTAPAPAPSTSAVSTTAMGAALRTTGLADPEVGSNGWAIGSERSANGRGLLLANPHLPWVGDLRFWEVQLTVPGQLDVYGSQLVGLPLVGIGFNDAVAWTHTDSAGHRFTAYRLALDPKSPTTYLEDGKPRQMTSTDASVEVRETDGSTRTVHRTLWSTHYGPVLAIPGFDWSTTTAVAVRDANLHNSAFFDQYYGMDTAKSLQEFQAVHEKHQGVPLFNTIAVGADGTAWYADTAATPNLSAQAQADYLKALDADPITKTAADNGIVVLDGSKSEFEWIDEPGARNPGLVPYAKMPKVERRDYVFNANDSYWMVNADHPFDEVYSPMHGDGRVAQTLRTRENATVLRDTSATGPSGADAKFDPDELRAAALLDRSQLERLVRPTMLERCATRTSVDVPELRAKDGSVVFARQRVDLRDACRVLAAWDGTFDASSKGAVLFRETWNDARRDEWAVPFDAARPIDTPSGVPAAKAGEADPLTTSLGRAVQVLQRAGVPLDASMGSTQHDGRLATGDPKRVYVGGGPSRYGITNVVGWDSEVSGSRETLPERPDTVTSDSALTKDGYWVNDGSSFLMTVSFTKDGPVARTILTYGETGDASSPLFTSQTQRFASKDWKEVDRTEAQIRAHRVGEPETVSG